LIGIVSEIDVKGRDGRRIDEKRRVEIDESNGLS